LGHAKNYKLPNVINWRFNSQTQVSSDFIISTEKIEEINSFYYPVGIITQDAADVDVKNHILKARARQAFGWVKNIWRSSQFSLSV
jgi:hypothetical protein